MNCPDALLLENLIVFPHVASRGFSLILPDLHHGSPEVLNAFSQAFQGFLVQLPREMRLQVQTTRENDLGGDLARFKGHTDEAPESWSRQVREERFKRFEDRIKAGSLFRQRVVLFLSVPLVHPPSWLASPVGLSNRYRALLAQANQQLDQQAQNLGRTLAPFGGSVTGLDDAGHHRYFAKVLNPSLVHRPGFDPLGLFDPTRSVHSNCWTSEGEGKPFGFLLDGHYHTIRVATRWPVTTNPLTLQPLCDLAGPNFRFTFNIIPIETREFIKQEERALLRLEGQYLSERKPSLLPALEKRRRRVQSLSGGLFRPFWGELLIHTWAKTSEEMRSQAGAMEHALQACGVQYFSPTLPTTHHRLFGQMWPGYPFGSYPHYRLYAESTFIPDLLLLRPSFTGYLEEAEALYEGVDGCPVGLRTNASGSPQHMLVFGGTGSGKSMFLQDFITQVWNSLGLLFLVDYGGSYEVLVRALDPTCQILDLRPNASFIHNYLGAQGLPLTSEFLGGAAAIVSLMAGLSGERDDRLVRSVAADAIAQLYLHRFSQLEREQPERAMELARLTLAWEGFRKEDPSIDLLESFVDFRDWTLANPDEAQSKKMAISEDQIVHALKDRRVRHRICQMASAHLRPEEQPTHSELQDWLRLYSAANREPLALTISKPLKDWCKGGANGSFLDGVSTVSFDGRVICWELANVGTEVPALPQIASHLVLTQSQRQICGRSRAIHKMALFEEAAAFLDIPGADTLMRRGYEQARKFNAVFVSVIQQYSRLRQLPIRASLMGNTQQFILMKQNDIADLKALAEDLGLPLSVTQAIQFFARPSDSGAAAFTLYGRQSPQPVCGVALHRPSPEMYYASCSTPTHVAARKAAMRGPGDIISKIKKASR